MARALTRRERLAPRNDRISGHSIGRGAAVVGLTVAWWLLAAGCHSSGPAGATPLPLADTSWRVHEIDGRVVQDPATAPSVTFHGADRISGSTGCNLYTASLTVTGSALRVGNVATTLRACSPALSDQESRFLTALAAVRSYRLDGDTAELAEVGGRTVLRFGRS